MKKHQKAILFSALAIFFIASAGAYFGAGYILENTRKSTGIVSGMPSPAVELSDSVKIYFSNSIYDPNMLDCSRTYPITRTVSQEPVTLGELAYVAVSELLKGPREDERIAGYFSSIYPGTRVKKIVIENETATVDFSEELNKDAAGSCRVQAIRSQITETLRQFTKANDVIITVNGESGEVLQP